jgi:hypothetical protein
VKIAYLDESGSAELSASTSHFVLLAVTLDAQEWKARDRAISSIKARYGVEECELHAGWLARHYVEQETVANFSTLPREQRITEALKMRDRMLLKRAALHGVESLKALKKTFAKTRCYLHLDYAQRRSLLVDIAREVASWAACELFAECIDKTTFGGRMPATPPFEEAFTQVVSRFHFYLNYVDDVGMIVQDRNDTVAKRLTELMRSFHDRGTRYTSTIPRLIETPLFVDSKLTSMVQVTDVCAYGLRRYFENGETELFDLVYPKIRRHNGRCVGGRHYRGHRGCQCRMCSDH